MNHTFLSLYNLSYKIIAKILAAHLKPVLSDIISPTQLTFVQGKGMMDNVFISHDIMNHTNRKKGNLSLTTLKINVVMAYDRLEWSFLA